jgi:co-chaperonin GroES (HSP10)
MDNLVKHLQNGGWGVLDMNKVRVLHGHVLVRFPPIPPEITLSNGLVVPREVAIQGKYWRIATVVSLGPGIVTKSGAVIPHELEAGDKVLVDKIFGDVVVEGSVEHPEYRVLSLYPVQQIEAILPPDTDDMAWVDMS